MEKNYNIKINGLPNIDLNLKIANVKLTNSFSNDNSNVIGCNVELIDNITKIKINTEYRDSINSFQNFVKKHYNNWGNHLTNYKFDISSILYCIFSDIGSSDYELYDFLTEFGYNDTSELLKRGIEIHKTLQSFKTMLYLHNTIIEYCYSNDLDLENCFTISEIKKGD